jgi:Trk K+ transport system NAD-binding subunit
MSDRSTHLTDISRLDLAKTQQQVKNDAIVVCGYGEVGWSLVNVLANEYVADGSFDGHFGPPNIVAFDNDPSLVEKAYAPTKNTIVLFGDAANPEVIRSSGVTNPQAIFISYDEFSKALSATSRLRLKFTDAPIYARAQSRSEAQSLKAAGATEVIVEADELPRSAMSLLKNEYSSPGDLLTNLSSSSVEEIRKAAAGMLNLSLQELDRLLELFECVDQDNNRLIDAKELSNYLKKSNTGIASDTETAAMEEWVNVSVQYPMKCIDFCRLYSRSPQQIKQKLADACLRVI